MTLTKGATMRFNMTSRRTAIFWLASGGIFFFMDMEILGETAFAEPTVIELSQEAAPTADALGDVLVVNPFTD